MAFQTVKIADIQSNPFRTDEAYRYNQEKIEALKESFTNTSYWENLLARKTKTGAIQLAYGHHRLEALRQLVG
jgi:ParB-like chromosome segregation protein Spo0J